MQRSTKGMTTYGAHHNMRESRRGYSPVAWLIPALGLTLASGLVINTIRGQNFSPPRYEQETRTEIVQPYDTISDFTLKCPVEGFRDQNYWNDQVMRLSGKPNSKINPGDKLQVPEPCYSSE